jgi:hypothetical protein
LPLISEKAIKPGTSQARQNRMPGSAIRRRMAARNSGGQTEYG